MADKIKILLADDEPDTLTLLGMTLTRAGYLVYKAHNGQECLTLAERERPDLIILDMMMPDLNGLDVLRRLRVVYAQPPVIFFTAKGRADDMTQGIEAGAYRYLVKPTSREKLLETVKITLAELKPTG